MTQEITVTKTEDHYEMKFEGNDTAYPAPHDAINHLGDELVPENAGDSVTFVGEYKSDAHIKNFDVEEVLETPGDDVESDEESESQSPDEDDEISADPTDEHVEEVGHTKAAGQAQQAEAQRLFDENGQETIADGGTSDRAEWEIVDSKLTDSREWEFRAVIRARLHNPNGSDVVTDNTFTARPKFDHLVESEGHVHEDVDYWWPDAYPADGDSAFYDSMADWEPVADLDDDDALLEECAEAATIDAQATLDGLCHDNPRVSEKLEGADR